ncbi:ABC transporter permease subunit [Azospirillum thermophilum]|nr:ABC transporter permease subunit [Azospirillum thermophilum]
MPRPVLTSLIPVAATALLPVAAAVAVALAIDPDWAETAVRTASGLLVTAVLAVPALVMGTVLGTLVGLHAGLRRPSAAGFTGLLLGWLAPALPGFLIAAAALALVNELGGEPGGGLAGGALGGGTALALGWLVLALPAACQAARLAGPAMDAALDSGPVRMAEGFGYGPREILWHHAAPLALAPVAGGLGTAILALLAGAAAVESLFGLPGAGALLVEASRQGETAAGLLAFAMLSGLSALLRAGARGLQRRLDPRPADPRPADLRAGG